MKIFFYLLVIFLFLTEISFGQIGLKRNPFSGSMVVTVEGGGTLAVTDFREMKPGFIGKGEFEYFFPSNNIGALGLRLFGGYGTIAGKGGATSNLPNIKEFKTNLLFVGFGAEYILNLGVVNPYIFGGVSYISFDPKDENGNKLPGNAAGSYDKNEINYNAEVGLRFLLSRNFSLNLSGGANISQNDVLDDLPNSLTNGKYDDIFYTLTVGGSYYFGVKRDADGDGVDDSYDICPDTPAGVVVDEFGCPIDSDNDGVPDYLDKCAATPANVLVDKNGCPIDSDGDGIPDYQDKCTDTPANVKVDDKGCPLDSDKDGVPDYKDECHNTSPGVKVDSVGCEIVAVSAPVETKEFVLNGSTNFEFGKTSLTPNAKKILSGFVKNIKANFKTKYKIEGFSDNVGSAAYNKKLSLERAKAVLDYFVEQGLSRSRFEVYGRGEENPIGDNKLEFGRALNRRVVITDVNYKKEKKSSGNEVLRDQSYNYLNDKVVEGTIFTDGNLYTIQVSSWTTRGKAESEVNKLRQQGHNAVLFQSNTDDNIKRFRVRIGYFQSLDGAKEYIGKYFAPKK